MWNAHVSMCSNVLHVRVALHKLGTFTRNRSLPSVGWTDIRHSLSRKVSTATVHGTVVSFPEFFNVSSDRL